MAKKVNKNKMPKTGVAQNGVSKIKGKTPDKKKLKEAAVKTPTAVTSLTPKLSGNKSNLKSAKETGKKNNEDYITFELGDTKRPKTGKLSKAEKKKLKRAKKLEAANEKEESDNGENEEDDSDTEVNEKINDVDTANTEDSGSKDDKTTEDDVEEEEASEDDAETDDDDEEEELKDDSNIAADSEDDEEEESEDDSDDENEAKSDSDSDSEPEEVKTEVKKKGIPDKTTDKKKKAEKEAKKEDTSAAKDSDFTLSFRGFPVCTEEEVMKKFIYNAVTEEDVEHLFIARRRNTKTRGFGFVTLKTKEAYDKFLKLNGTEAEGKTIEVSKSTFERKEQQKKSEKRKHEDDSGPAAKKQKSRFEKSDGATLIVKNIDFKTTDEELREHLEYTVSKNDIKQIRFPKKPDGGSRGFAFVEFTSQEALAKAKELNGSELSGRKLVVEPSKPNNSPKRNSNDFSKFKGDNQGFNKNKNFKNDRRPFNKNRKFDGKNKNFKGDKGKFGRESKGKGNRYFKTDNQ